MECLDITLRNQVQWDDCPPRKITHSESTQVWKIPKFVSKFLIPGPCKGNQVCISLFLCPQKWPQPSVVQLRMTECSDFKRNDTWLQFFAKLAPLRLHFYLMCHVAMCTLQGFPRDSTSYASPPWTNSGLQSASIDGHLTPWSDYLWSCRGPEWGQRAFGVGMVTSYSPSQSPATSCMGTWKYAAAAQSDTSFYAGSKLTGVGMCITPGQSIRAALLPGTITSTRVPWKTLTRLWGHVQIKFISSATKHSFVICIIHLRRIATGMHVYSQFGKPLSRRLYVETYPLMTQSGTWCIGTKFCHDVQINLSDIPQQCIRDSDQWHL